MGGTRATLEVISPEQAQRYVDEQAPNRRLRQAHIDQMARDMEHGRWRTNGETVKFYEDGRLADGQNRMLACVKAGVPFATWVVRGLTEPDRDAVDKNIARSLADTLTLRGASNSGTLASAIGWYTRLVKATGGVLPARTNYPTEAEADALMGSTMIRESTERVATAHQKAGLKVGRPGLFAALHCLFTERYGDVADTFFDQVILGAGLVVDSPAFMLRARVGAGQKYTSTELAAMTIKAFTAMRTGQKISLLRWIRSGKNTEGFPSL